MTRGEAKQEFFNILESGELRFDEQSFIDKIYDSFENRSCDNCKYLANREENLKHSCLIEVCRTCMRNNNDNWEQK